MKKMITVILLISALTLTLNVQAAGNTGFGKLGKMLFWQGHTGLLIKHENMLNADACGRRDWYILSDDYPYFKEVYSMLLMAKAANKDV